MGIYMIKHDPLISKEYSCVVVFQPVFSTYDKNSYRQYVFVSCLNWL